MDLSPCPWGRQDRHVEALVSSVVGSCLTSGSDAPGVNCWGSNGPWMLTAYLSFFLPRLPRRGGIEVLPGMGRASPLAFV